MIHDVDESLRQMIERLVIANGEVDVTFDAPTRDWAARQSRPTINAFLYDIREDLERRDVAPREVRDETGRIVARLAPVRRFRLSYLLTAWTNRPQDEHRLLSSLLATFLAFDQIPGGTDGYLTGSLVDAPVPVLVALALPPSADRSISDVWSALGGELKASLDLVITAPIDPGRTFHAGAPVMERLRIRTGDFVPDMDPPDVERERRRRLGVAVARTTVDDVPGKPGFYGVGVGDDEYPGRGLRIERDWRPDDG